MPGNLPTTTLNRFRLPVHPAGRRGPPVRMLYHRQGKFFVGWGPGATEEPVGLEYEIGGSGFGWRRLAKGEKPLYIMDDATKRTQERGELSDPDQALWPVGSDGSPLDPWSRVAQLYLVRVQDGTPLIFETNAQSAVMEAEDLVAKICHLARNKNPDARPVMVTGTRQKPNAKSQTYWIPTFTITRWIEPNGTVIVPEPEPQRMPGIEDPTPAAKPSAEALFAVGGVPPAAPRERKPRNAYAHSHAKSTGKPGAALKDDLDDEIPY
jgi:hypothetical protein